MTDGPRHPIRLTVTGHEGYEGGSMIEAFVGQLERVVQVAWDKNRSYGDAWRKQGYMGNLARILSKTSRLKNMQWRDMPFCDEEATHETVGDLIAICVFYLLNHGQENKWGLRE